MTRDWQDARAAHLGKPCRVCGRGAYGEPAALMLKVELHHLVGRARDRRVRGPRGGVVAYVHPASVVPVCKFHHDLIGDHELWPVLTEREREWCSERLGYGPARRAVGGRAWLESEAA